MGCRRSFIGFTGAVMVLFGMAMIIVGSTTSTADQVIEMTNNAVGVPMWTGLVIIMCGVGNLVQAFAYSKKQSRDQLFPFSIVVAISNLVAMAASGVCIGLYSYSATAGRNGTNALNMLDGFSLYYSTIIVAAIIILIIAVLAMFVDCCFPFIFPTTALRPYNVGAYDSPPRYPAQDVFKA